MMQAAWWEAAWWQAAWWHDAGSMVGGGVMTQVAWWEAAPWQAWQASPEQRQDAEQHHGQDEESDDDFCEVDIGAYLSYEATEALMLMPLLQKEASTNRWLLQLQAIKACLEEIQKTTTHHPGDYIEARSGRSYLMIHQQLKFYLSLKSIVAGSAPPAQKAYVDEVKSLHRRLQDILVAACCRFMNQRILQEQGLPDELKRRLSAAFDYDDTALDEHTWSLFGNSKWHIFTSGKFHQKKRHRGRRRDLKHTVNTVEEPEPGSELPTVAAHEEPGSELPTVAVDGSVFEPDEEPGSELPTVAAHEEPGSELPTVAVDGSVFEPDEEPGSELPTVAADAQVNMVNTVEEPGSELATVAAASWRIWISL